MITCVCAMTRMPQAACRSYVTQLGEAGWLKYAVPRAYGGILESLDLRSLCLDSRDPWLRVRPGRVRVRHAGPRFRADLAVRFRAAETEVSARGRRWHRASPRLRSRKPRPARTWHRCRPPPAATDPPSSSTAARPGSRMPASPRTMWCSAAGPRAARRASWPSSSMPTILA